MPKFAQALLKRLPRRSVAYARARALLSRRKLPPGDFVRLDEIEKNDRTFLIQRAVEVGPIFKAIAWDEFWVCVVGLERGRRLLREHGAALRPMTLKLEPLFPKGFLRQMVGEDHRRYRKALSRAIRADDLTTNLRQLDAIAASALAAYAATPRDADHSAADYIRTLNAIASGMLIQVFFGAQFDSPQFERVMQGYHKLGPHGLVWNIGEKQKEAFAEIRDYLLEQFSGPPETRPPGSEHSILGQLVREGALDATLLGNLIYMVEMGRYDTYSLFRWLTKYAAEFPDLLTAIARDDPVAPPAGPRSLAEAFVLETLRMDQSERLIRMAQRDFVFEGHLIPKYATVRICLWESHKAPEAFPEPFRFDPARWIAAKDPGPDQFAPFGLDHHQCPFGDVAIRSSMIFLRALARSYIPAPIADGLPVRGIYHWEPASRFAVKLHPR